MVRYDHDKYFGLVTELSTKCLCNTVNLHIMIDYMITQGSLFSVFLYDRSTAHRCCVPPASLKLQPTELNSVVMCRSGKCETCAASQAQWNP